MKSWIRAATVGVCLVILATAARGSREGFACSATWSAGAAGWKPRTALIHNEHEPEQNGLAWSPETMPAPYRRTA